MTGTVNTLLKGWPATSEITGKRGQFLGYKIEGRYFPPLGRKLFKPFSAAVWTGAVFTGIMAAADMPEDAYLGALLTWTALSGGAGQFLVWSVLRSRFELEIRPQAIRVWRRLGWREYDRSDCQSFAVFPHDGGRREEMREQMRLQRMQNGEEVSLPGQFYRNSASVSLIVRGQRVDIAHICDAKGGPQGPRKALDLFRRLAACHEDVQQRGWGL